MWHEYIAGGVMLAIFAVVLWSASGVYRDVMEIQEQDDEDQEMGSGPD